MKNTNGMHLKAKDWKEDGITVAPIKMKNKYKYRTRCVGMACHSQPYKQFICGTRNASR